MFNSHDRGESVLKVNLYSLLLSSNRNMISIEIGEKPFYSDYLTNIRRRVTRMNGNSVRGESIERNIFRR